MTDQLYEMTITATGEVRDTDGNLISSTPIETVQTITHEQMLALTEGQPE